MSEVFRAVNESLSMDDVVRHFGYTPNRAGFIKSPFEEERTASCKLYPQSFYDFSSGVGGDIIRFASAILGVNNWEACRYLVEAFSLPFSLSGHADNREQIRHREQERQRQQEKEKRFKEAWRAEVDRLKTWENIYQRAIEEKIFPPLSDLQAFTVAELQKVSYKLDMLCVQGSRREQEEILTAEGGGIVSDEKKRPLLVPLSDIQEKMAEWLVPGIMPRGQINIWAGDGGSGKTTAWCGLVAAISTGSRVFFENEVPDEFVRSTPEKVIFFSSEDSLEYTLKARLRKAGANMDNIYSVSLKDERFSQIKFNSQLLKDLIREVRPALVVFDPLQAFIPPEIQMGQRNAMRNCLNPLIGLGEEYGTTFLIIVHTNKRQGTYGRNRIADSADVWDIARSVMIIGQTQEKNIRYMSHEKCNYGELGETALFTIRDGVAQLKGYSDKRDADFVRERDFSAYQAPQRQDAEKFILDFLKNGKKPTADLDEAAKAAGVSRNTLGRAKTNLRERGLLAMKSEGYGQNKAWYCYLIDQQFS